MTEIQPPRPHRRQWVWPLALVITVVTASGRSQIAAPALPHFDKVAHLAVFGFLALLVCRMARGWTTAGLVVAAVSLFGLLDEWHQGFTPGRSVDFRDWLADTLGAALAVTSYTAWPLCRRWLETPLFRRRGRGEKSPAVETA